jgi:hypothetical protein
LRSVTTAGALRALREEVSDFRFRSTPIVSSIDSGKAATTQGAGQAASDGGCR